MKNYLCKWSNGDVVLVSARSRQEVRLILDEVADPGSCEIVQFKGPFAFELNPKMPKPPPRQRSSTGEHLNPFSNEFIAPEDPTERPLIARCAGNTGTTFYADVWQEAGGQLTAEETAALQRWRSATTASQPQQSAGNRTWVTEEDLNKAGLIDNPYHVQVKLGSQEYGRYTSRLYKGITKAFFPRTYEALKAVQETEYGEEAAGKRDDAIKKLAAAVGTDVYDEEKQKQLELKQAKLYVDALAGNRQAMVAVMTDQSVNVYGPAAGDEEEEDEDSDASDEDDSDDGMDIFQSLRAGRAMELAALFGAGR